MKLTQNGCDTQIYLTGLEEVTVKRFTNISGQVHPKETPIAILEMEKVESLRKKKKKNSRTDNDWDIPAAVVFSDWSWLHTKTRNESDFCSSLLFGVIANCLESSFPPFYCFGRGD